MYWPYCTCAYYIQSDIPSEMMNWAIRVGQPRARAGGANSSGWRNSLAMDFDSGLQISSTSPTLSPSQLSPHRTSPFSLDQQAQGTQVTGSSSF
jgi:hypothetical protein